MLVVNWMSPHLVSAGPDDSLSQASRAMKEYHIRHLPVVEEGRLVGIITDRDLKGAASSEANNLQPGELAYFLSRTKVRDVMTMKVHTAHCFDTIEDAALIMLQYKISGLPVVDDQEKVLGMLSQNDIFRALVNLTGVVQGGIQFALDLPDQPGSIRQAADVIRRFGGRMVGILTTHDRVAQGRRKVYLRMKEVDRSHLMEITDELSKVGVLLYVLDSEGGERRLLTYGRGSRDVPPAPEP
ncbi:MAG: CBS and ACT domain-containing protein [Deltaproteobacteria bacterium]|nr:CBS and ACT domain-containing protein [Deltaproteobacteria bacterium]